MEGRRLALATRAQPVEVKQVWIGSLAVDASCTEPAVDSSPALRHGDWPVLAQRLHEHGYLAFSRFWAEERLEPALRHVQALGQLRDLAGAGFEVNTATLAANGAEDPLQRLREDVQLQDVLRAVLLEAGDVVVPEQFTFQLSWVRGKGKGEGTDVHVDYYHVDPEHAGEDVLEEDDFKSYNVWTRLSYAPEDSSFLVVCPGSHKLPLSSHRQPGQGVPEALAAQIQSNTARWHVFDRALCQPGTLVLMSLRLAHGATPNASSAMRFSWDMRFRCHVKDARDVVYGMEPAPHWSSCTQWSHACHAQHPHMHAYIVPMMLVNRRLRALGQPWLLPELLDMVFARLCKAVTPRWLEVPSPKFRRRMERVATGVFFPRAVELARTGRAPRRREVPSIDVVLQLDGNDE